MCRAVSLIYKQQLVQAHHLIAYRFPWTNSRSVCELKPALDSRHEHPKWVFNNIMLIGPQVGQRSHSSDTYEMLSCMICRDLVKC